MSYTPPAGNAAHFNFTGRLDARDWVTADLSFETGVLRAHNFIPTRFGSPLAERRSGFLATKFGLALTTVITYGSPAMTTAFGAPSGGSRLRATGANNTAFGSPRLRPVAQSFNSTVFGLPNSPFPQTGTATGFASLTFGDPRVVTRCWAFSVPRSTYVSTAYTATTQTEAASGYSTTRFGEPIRRVAPAITVNTYADATAWIATQFGTPRAPQNVTGSSTGFSSTRIGWPSARSPSTMTRFGSPLAYVLAKSAGWSSTAVGSPSALHTASPVAPGTIFGTAAARHVNLATGGTKTLFGRPASFIGGHVAFGLRTGERFGVPMATRRFPRAATGWTDTHLGTHSALVTHRAFHSAPSTMFGTPTLKRAPTC